MRPHASRRRLSPGLVLAVLLGLVALPGPTASSAGASTPILSVAVNPFNSQNVIVGTAGGVYVSTDGGATWAGKTSGLTNVTVNAIVFDPKIASLVYAAGIGGVFKSVDGGTTWTAQNSGLSDLNVDALGIDYGTTSTLHAGTTTGVFTSLDSGGSWTLTSSGLPSPANVRALLVDPKNSLNTYVGTRGSGFYYSTNASGTWSPANAGLGNLNVNALTLDPTTPSSAHAATDGGVFNTVNAPAATWTAATGLPANVPALSIVVDPLNTPTMYAGLQGGGVYKSTNAGGSWSLTSALIASYTVYALAESPGSPETIYAGTDGGVLVSSDGGSTWGLHPLSPLQSQLAVTPTAITFVENSTCQGLPVPVDLTLSDPAGVGFGYSVKVSSDRGWLSATPLSGSVPAGADATSQVTVFLSSCVPSLGSYSGQVVITTTPAVAGSPATIPVTLYVVTPRAYLPAVANGATLSTAWRISRRPTSHPR